MNGRAPESFSGIFILIDIRFSMSGSLMSLERKWCGDAPINPRCASERKIVYLSVGIILCSETEKFEVGNFEQIIVMNEYLVFIKPETDDPLKFVANFQPLSSANHRDR
jgi:hypothetical protein